MIKKDLYNRNTIQYSDVKEYEMNNDVFYEYFVITEF